MLVDLFIPKNRKSITALLSAIGLGLTLSFTLIQIGEETTLGFNNMVVLDGFSRSLSNALLLVSGLAWHWTLVRLYQADEPRRGEYYTLTAFQHLRHDVEAQAADLIVVFLALELLSIPLYVLAAFDRPRVEIGEAGLKYFLLGAIRHGIHRLRDRARLRGDRTHILTGIVTFLGSTRTPACS